MQFIAHLKTVREEEQEMVKAAGRVPVHFQDHAHVRVRQKDPIVVGLEIKEGIAMVRAPLMSLWTGCSPPGRLWLPSGFRGRIR